MAPRVTHRQDSVDAKGSPPFPVAFGPHLPAADHQIPLVVHELIGFDDPQPRAAPVESGIVNADTPAKVAHLLQVDCLLSVAFT
jgi:hypothetical protein